MKRTIILLISILMTSGILSAQETTAKVLVTDGNTQIVETKTVRKISLKELENRYLTNQKKGKELFKLKQFKKSITYSDKAIFYQNIIMEKIKNKKIAINKLKEADSWVQKAKRVVTPRK